MRALSLAAVGILLLPLGGLAAPADTIASSIMGSRDALSPHMSCYGGGEEFENLGSWDQVNATVLAGCHDFASYSGHRFKIGDSVSYHLVAPRLSNPFPFHVSLGLCANVFFQVDWCGDVKSGKGSIKLSMQYKGESSTWLAENKRYGGGLVQYCWAGVEWALTGCVWGGVFENHRLGSGARTGWQFWDVRLDPNSGAC